MSTRLSDWEIVINRKARLAAKHRALELLAWMVKEELPAGIVEAVETWGPIDLTKADVAALREVFPSE